MAASSPEPRPLYEVIYDVLREHLEDDSFPPGLVFGEASVARAFGSSRIPAAAALQRLRSEGLLRPFNGRGLIAAGAEPDKLLRIELGDAGLKLHNSVASTLEMRKHHGRIYPQVEHTIAASLAFGKFLVNESALAEYYEVSRTVAHEVLTRLERTGLIAQEGNQRWYAGPLTADDLRDHFEMRWLLEPVALTQSMDDLDADSLARRRTHLEKTIAQDRLAPLKIEKLETELHVETVLARANPRMAETIRRSQLIVIPTHSTFAAQPHVEEVRHSLAEHLEIFDLIIKGRKKPAAQALEHHVRGALLPNVDRLSTLGTLPEDRRPPFLIPAERTD